MKRKFQLIKKTFKTSNAVLKANSSVVYIKWHFSTVRQNNCDLKFTIHLEIDNDRSFVPLVK